MSSNTCGFRFSLRNILLSTITLMVISPGVSFAAAMIDKPPCIENPNTPEYECVTDIKGMEVTGGGLPDWPGWVSVNYFGGEFHVRYFLCAPPINWWDEN